uniref:EF-hand domain-containing protein n=1 Tax=Macrostomum lignano TaxID=282301 RepID=A0A1I8HKT0_9PLAT
MGTCTSATTCTPTRMLTSPPSSSSYYMSTFAGALSLSSIVCAASTSATTTPRPTPTQSGSYRCCYRRGCLRRLQLLCDGCLNTVSTLVCRSHRYSLRVILLGCGSYLFLCRWTRNACRLSSQLGEQGWLMQPVRQVLKPAVHLGHREPQATVVLHRVDQVAEGTLPSNLSALILSDSSLLLVLLCSSNSPDIRLGLHLHLLRDVPCSQQHCVLLFHTNVSRVRGRMLASTLQCCPVLRRTPFMRIVLGSSGSQTRIVIWQIAKCTIRPVINHLRGEEDQHSLGKVIVQLLGVGGEGCPHDFGILWLHCCTKRRGGYAAFPVAQAFLHRSSQVNDDVHATEQCGHLQMSQTVLGRQRLAHLFKQLQQAFVHDVAEVRPHENAALHFPPSLFIVSHRLDDVAKCILCIQVSVSRAYISAVPPSTCRSVKAAEDSREKKKHKPSKSIAAAGEDSSRAGRPPTSQDWSGDGRLGRTQERTQTTKCKSTQQARHHTTYATVRSSQHFVRLAQFGMHRGISALSSSFPSSSLAAFLGQLGLTHLHQLPAFAVHLLPNYVQSILQAPDTLQPHLPLWTLGQLIVRLSYSRLGPFQLGPKIVYSFSKACIGASLLFRGPGSSSTNGSGCVSAQAAAAFLKRSGLSDSLLSKIWEVADFEKRGLLDKQGFFIALKLIALVQAGKEPLVGNLTVPVSSPAIKPATPQPAASVASAVVDRTAAVSSAPDAIVAAGSPAKVPVSVIAAASSSSLSLSSTTSTTAVVSVAGSGGGGFSEQLIQQADAAFASLGPEAGDRLPGAKVKPYLLQSGLPTATLVSIWDASDEDRDGCLTRQEFRKAFALVRQAVGRALAARTAAQVMAEVDTDKDGIVSGQDVRQLFLQTGLEPATLARIWDQADTGRSGRLTAEQFGYAWRMVQAEMASADASGGLAAASVGVTPSASIPSVPQLSDGILAEAGRVQQRRQQAEADCTRLEAELRARRAELQLQQREADHLASACLQLEQQKCEAQRRVEEVEERERKLAGSVDECEQRRSEEAAQLEALKARLAQDQAGVRGAAQETERLRKELTSLTQEEARLSDSAQGAKSRLAGLERELEAENRRLEQEAATLSALQQQLADLEAGRLAPDDVEAAPAAAAPSAIAAPAASDPFAGGAAMDDPFGGGADPFQDAAVGGSGEGGADFFADDPFSVKPQSGAAPAASQDDPFRFDAAFGGPSDFADAFGGGGGAAAASAPPANDPFGGGGGGFSWHIGDPFAPPKSSGQQMPPALSEQEQVVWATAESERVAKQQMSLQQREEEEMQRALRLSMHEQ